METQIIKIQKWWRTLPRCSRCGDISNDKLCSSCKFDKYHDSDCCEVCRNDGIHYW